jgi:metacaspase-1
MNVAHALIIGINYTGTTQALQGCVRDALFTRDKLIETWGWSPHHITLLVDDPSVPDAHMPTRKNILAAVRHLVFLSHRYVLSPCWISYSGHGTQQHAGATDGDERDGLDECLVPVDFATAGCITDNDWRSECQHFHSHSTVIGLMDACHSGTIWDLPWHAMFSSAGLSFMQSERVNPAKPTARMLLISACDDPETAAEIYQASTQQVQGVLTTMFWDIVVKHVNQELQCSMLLTKLRQAMIEHGFHQQIPQLHSTESVLKEPFFVPRKQQAWVQGRF